ncbi:MAG: hypothetical protein AAGB26_17005 [Planctomycetota bacterium]
MELTLSVISACTALLAVFVSPVLNWFVVRRNIDATLAIANKQLITPVKQSWTNSLRDAAADFTSRAYYYHTISINERAKLGFEQLIVLENRVTFMLNMDDPDHAKLSKSLNDQINSLVGGSAYKGTFFEAYEHSRDLMQQILQKEYSAMLKPLGTTR